MKQTEIIYMLEILTNAFKDIQEEEEEYSDEDLRSKAKYTLLRLMLEDDKNERRN